MLVLRNIQFLISLHLSSGIIRSHYKHLIYVYLVALELSITLLRSSSMTTRATLAKLGADSMFAPSQWETALFCNDVSVTNALPLQWEDMGATASQINDNSPVYPTQFFRLTRKETAYYWPLVMGIRHWVLDLSYKGSWGAFIEVFISQSASNEESGSMAWRHHASAAQVHHYDRLTI